MNKAWSMVPWLCLFMSCPGRAAGTSRWCTRRVWGTAEQLGGGSSWTRTQLQLGGGSSWSWTQQLGAGSWTRTCVSTPGSSPTAPPATQAASGERGCYIFLSAKQCKSYCNLRCVQVWLGAVCVHGRGVRADAGQLQHQHRPPAAARREHRDGDHLGRRQFTTQLKTLAKFEWWPSPGWKHLHWRFHN